MRGGGRASLLPSFQSPPSAEEGRERGGSSRYHRARPDSARTLREGRAGVHSPSSRAKGGGDRGVPLSTAWSCPPLPFDVPVGVADGGQREGSQRPWLWHRCRCRGGRRSRPDETSLAVSHGGRWSPPIATREGGGRRGAGGEDKKTGSSPRPVPAIPPPKRPHAGPAREPANPTHPLQLPGTETRPLGWGPPWRVALPHAAHKWGGRRTPTCRHRPACPQISRRGRAGGAAEPSGLRRGLPLRTRGGGASAPGRGDGPRCLTCHSAGC